MPFVAALCLMACGTHKAHEEHDHEHEAPEHAAAHAEDADEIQLSPEVAARMGVKVDTVGEGPLCSVIKVAGTVEPSAQDIAVVAAPKSGVIHFPSSVRPGVKVSRGTALASVSATATSGGDANAAAKAALDAAKRELDRIEPLYRDRLATAADYNAALAAYEAAKAAYSPAAASGAAVAPISGTILSLDAVEGQYVEAGAPIATITASNTLTLRLEVPRKYARDLPEFTDARIEGYGAGESFTISQVGGHRIGAPTAVAASAFIPVYFSIPAGADMPVAGSTFEAYLLGHNGGRKGIMIPREALSEQQGLYFVYERLDDECYRKLPVTLGTNTGQSVEITSGLEPGQIIVTCGTTTLRLAENAKAIPEGHSHNH